MVPVGTGILPLSHPKLKTGTERIRCAGRESAFTERYLPGWAVIDGRRSGLGEPPLKYGHVEL